VDADRARELLELAQEVVPGLKGLEQAENFARLDERYDDLLAALEWFLAQGRVDESIALARALASFWQATKRLEAATEAFERALALPGGDVDLRAHGCVEAGLLWFWRGDDARAAELFDRAFELAQGLEAPTAAALALTGHARIALRNDDLEESRRLCLEARELGGAARAARASTAHVLGVTAQIAGDLEEARSWMNERIELAREDGNAAALGIEANNLAMVERQLGDFERAEELSREAVDNFHRRRDEWAIPFGLSGLAAAAVGRGDLVRAATLIGAAEALVEAQGSAWPPDERPHYEAVVAAVDASGDAAVAQARAGGAALSVDEAVAYALSRAA
jgi:tetratricopeptide (TPR) repeat protein